MAEMSVEIEGSAEEVVRVLRQLGDAGRHTTPGGAGGSMETPAGGGGRGTAAAGARTSGAVEATPAGEWTEALASDFLAGLQPAARRMAGHVWRAGEAGIHRSVLCRHTELTPPELGSLLMRMGHALRRFRGEHGMTLSRPVASNSPLQSYRVDPDFAAAANARMFDESSRERLVDDAGRP